MAETFECPHCANRYPILPTLVGRKVRCTHCKNAFQLQYDGTARKVLMQQGTQPAAAESSAHHQALERRSEPGGKEPGVPATQAKATSAAQPGVRPQTRAIKRHTERIKKIRSSLQSAAADVADNIERSTQEHEDPAVKTGAPSKGVSDRHRQQRPLTVVRGSGAEDRQRRINTRLFMAVAVVVLLIVAWIALIDVGPARAALYAFTATVPPETRDYPERMNVFRERMWVYSRDGQSLPPIVLNADDAELVSEQAINWAEVVAACSPELDGMHMNRSLAIWHKPTDEERIEQAWASYANKVNVNAFYEQLRRHDFVIVRFEELQPLLLKKGVEREAVYVLSLLLAGTADAEGTACEDLGLRSDVMPAMLLLSEFRGRDGNVLLDAGGYYTSTSTPFYCGLVAGFTDFTGIGQRADDWRVLDLRESRNVEQFYAAAANPLRALAVRAHEDMRAQMEVPGDELPAPVEAE